MQLQARFASKLLVDHVRYSSIQHHLRIHNVHLLRSSACIQCSLHFQLRRLSDAPKGAPPQDESLKELNTSQSTPNTLLDGHGSDLPSARAGRRHDVTKRISHLMDNLQGNIFIASQRINDLTGYSSIEELKKQITMLETKVQDAQQAVRTARLTYKTTVTDRASTQREVTTLLARKDSWTPSDLERFTALYRMDHSNEQAVQEAATRLADAESNMEHLAHQLRSSILARYHEEQIWSDKIRRMSTWGTWVLMGVNVLLFLVFQFGFEPWRRKRLVQGFEEKVREALEQVKLPGSSFTQIDELQDPTVINKHQEPEESTEDENLSSDISSHLASVSLQGEDEEEDVELEGSTTFNVREAFSPTTQRINYKAKVLDRYVAATKELFSDGIVEMRKQDILIIALEGAAVGATIATILNTFIRSA